MRKFAIDDKYTEALERERANKDEQLRQALLNYQHYYSKGWDAPILCDLTANARPTLTTVLNPTTPNQDNP